VKFKGPVPANAWFRIARGPLESKENVFVLKSGVTIQIAAPGAQVAGANLVLPAKTGTTSITYQWAHQK
jgi:hypothetical protein